MPKTFLFQAIQFSQTVLIQTIQFSLSIVFVHTQLNVKTVLFQTIQFSVTTHFSSIWPIDWILSGGTNLSQSWPGSDGNEGVLPIPQCSSITEQLESSSHDIQNQRISEESKHGLDVFTWIYMCIWIISL